MKLVFFDTETTGNQPKDYLCQIAWKEAGAPMRAGLFKPPVPVPIEATIVHNITNKMLEDKHPFKGSPEWNEVKELFESDDTIVIAHNASFDLGMLKKEDIVPKRHICTLRVARALDPEGKLAKYSLQYLRYALELEVEGIAHSADGDVLVLEALFERLLAKMSEKYPNKEEALKEMTDISGLPSLIKSFMFGKHNGKDVSEVALTDRGYLEWLLKQKLESSPDDEDWIFTLRTHLKK